MIDREQFTNLYNRLKKAEKIKSQRQLAEIIGVHEQTVTEFKSGRRQMKLEHLLSLKEAFPNFDLSELLNAESNKKLDKVQGLKSAITNLPSKGIAYYNLDASAGPIEMFQDEKEILERIYIPGFGNCDVAINVWGDSMYPHYRAGNIALCQELEDKSQIQFGEVYLIITGQLRTVKYVRKHKEKHMVILRSANDKYDDMEIEVDKIIKIYLVKGKVERNAI
jgi:phage repressor protein C with HTH and peptisase S24 domain